MSAKEKIAKLEMELSEAATTIQNDKSHADAKYRSMEKAFKSTEVKCQEMAKDAMSLAEKREDDLKRMEAGFKAADGRLTKTLREKEQQIKTLQTELQKSRTLLERLNELILWFEQKILNADGSFPKFKWYNIGKLITIVAKLAEWLPSTIAIFKKK